MRIFVMVRKRGKPMTVKWGSCAILAICLAVLAGCRTTQPNVKPDDIAKEEFRAPPMEARYETTGYPKLAFDTGADPTRRMFDNQKNAGVMPARGTAMPGMGGGGMR
jgi:hypothetical protein